MELSNYISKRKSCRSFTGEPLGADILEAIRSFPMKPLYPEIQVAWEILPRDQIKCICPWTTPQVIAVYSEEKPGYLENAGFLFQQLDLYIHSIGLGVCWLGMGRPDAKTAPVRNDGLKFVITLAFGTPKGDILRKEIAEFKRKPLSAISDREDARLEPARLAPSSVNSQPWYFTHTGDTVHAYCSQKGLFKASLGEMNQIDMGIALAHLYIANPDTFRFFREAAPQPLKGYGYIGSFTL